MIQLFEVINFTYFYRDGANWKNGGNTPFTNKQGLPIEEIDKRIRAAMLDGNCQFYPEDVDLDNYFYCDCQYENGDHHEFDGVAFSQSAVRLERNKPPPPKLTCTLDSPKHLARVAANSAALAQQTTCGTALQFSLNSSLPGVIVCLRGVPAFQLALGFNQPHKIESDSTIRSLVAQNLR
jgi:hypothetical protein